MQQNVQAKPTTRRWMKSVIAASQSGIPALPWEGKTTRAADERAAQATKAQRAVAAR